MRKSKTITKIIWIVITVCVILIAWFVISQRNNLQALLVSAQYSSADLETQLSDENAAIAGAMEKLDGSVQDLSEEDKQRLLSGTITEEEAINIMLGKTGGTDETGTAVSGSAETGQSAQTAASETETDDTEKQIDTLIAKIYILRTTYESKLESLLRSAASDYQSLSTEERSSSKMQLFSTYSSQATALESECDQQISGVLSELQSLLEKTGGDVSIIQDIKTAYESEKTLKKAYYIHLFMEH